MAPRVTGGADGRKDFEEAGRMGGAALEVMIDGRAQRLRVVMQQDFERLERGDALR